MSERTDTDMPWAEEARKMVEEHFICVQSIGYGDREKADGTKEFIPVRIVTVNSGETGNFVLWCGIHTCLSDEEVEEAITFIKAEYGLHGMRVWGNSW